MRISDQQILALAQYQMNADYDQLAQAQLVLSTGRQINTPADNPVGAAAALELQDHQAQTNSFSTTASDTLSWLQTTDTSLSSVNDALIQARTLAVQGGDTTLTQDQRQAIAANVAQLLQTAVQAANATYDGRYVLSGYKTGTIPFTITTNGGVTAVTYQGDGNAIQREISPGQMMQINTPGSTALPQVFAAIAQLQGDLQSGNTAAISGTDLQALDDAHDGLLVAQAGVGANINRIQSVQSTIETTQLNLSNQYSQLVDANMAEAATNFSERQATYQAALSAAAKVIQPTLLDFLK
jgi:flagellar hook-associated protein 3 FlgL